MTAQRWVTIVAPVVGHVGGQESATARLVLGLLDSGWQVQVVTTRSELPPHPRLRTVCLPIPLRPAPFGKLIFAFVATLVVVRTRRGVLHLVGPVSLNAADVITVHFSNVALRRHTTIRRSRRRGLLYDVNERAN